MDWFTLLLIFIFFVLPLLQRLLADPKKGQRTPADLNEGEGDEDLVVVELEPEHRGPRPARRAEPAAEERRSAGWSEGWAGWPGPQQGRPTAPERPAPREERPWRTPQEVGRVPAPPAPTRPRRAPRMEQPPSAPSPAPPPLEVEIIPGPRAGGPSPPAHPRSTGAVVLRRRRKGSAPTSYIRRLNDPREVRRAIVLSEVLGPPVSERHGTPDGSPRR
jgi:hypothetical protein